MSKHKHPDNKYLHYVPDLYAEASQEGVMVWKLPLDFCQSRLGDRSSGSNACTIIALLLSQRVHQMGIRVWGQYDNPLNKLLLTALAEAIVEANDIHERLMNANVNRDPNLTYPEAVEAAAQRLDGINEWETWYEMSGLLPKMIDHLNDAIRRWSRNDRLSSNRDLYAVLFGSGRTVLIIFQKDLQRITMSDSHSHWAWACGAVIAQAGREQLRDMCNWYSHLCQECYGNQPIEFEMTFFYFVYEECRHSVSHNHALGTFIFQQHPTGTPDIKCHDHFPSEEAGVSEPMHNMYDRRRRYSARRNSLPRQEPPEEPRNFLWDWDWWIGGGRRNQSGGGDLVEESLRRDHEDRALRFLQGPLEDSDSSSSGANGIFGHHEAAHGGGDQPSHQGDCLFFVKLFAMGFAFTSVVFTLSRVVDSYLG